MTPQEVAALALSYDQEELLYLLQQAPNHEIPARKLKRKLVKALDEKHLVYVKNGFVGLNGAGLLYYKEHLEDRHDFTPSVLVHWAIEVLAEHISGDEDEIGIGVDGKARGWQGATAWGQDIVAGLRKFAHKKFAKTT